MYIAKQAYGSVEKLVTYTAHQILLRQRNPGTSDSVSKERKWFTIQGIHEKKKMVRFQKLIKKCISTLHGHDIHCQQRELSKFLMRYQRFASHAL
jgi:hypothetical protein